MKKQRIPGYLGGTPIERESFTFYIKSFFKRIGLCFK
jgi:hypothetical protein